VEKEKNMQIEKIENIRNAAPSNVSIEAKRALIELDKKRKTYSEYIGSEFSNGNIERQIFLAEQEAITKDRTRPGSSLAIASGPYFLNEDVSAGSRTKEVFACTDKRSDWIPGKLKLGPGISLIEPPKLYQELLSIGENDPRLSINYDAPFGTEMTRRGIRRMMDCKIDPNGNFFKDSGVYLTQGATEGIDLFMEIVAQKYPNKKVVFLGISYYTGAYSAVQKGLRIERIAAESKTIIDKGLFFPSTEEIMASLTEDVKAFVLTMPNNPNGETYSNTELRRVLQLAKDKNLLILFDCIFEDMYFDQGKNFQSDVLQTAKEMGALDNIVVVDSLSKRQNIPGARIGFLATTNEQVASALEDIVIGRRCNPPLTIEPVVQFEALAREVKIQQMQNPNASVDNLVRQVMAKNMYQLNPVMAEKMYKEWDNWGNLVRQYYKENLQIVNLILEKTSAMGSPDKAAFNTLAKLADIPSETNSNDFLAKLMFTLATYTQSGACFGMSQEAWDKYYGLWVRISYATKRTELIEGLIRLIVFTEQYIEKDLGNKNKYPVLSIQYNNQI
jgi:aspartate/methionine/tyrosine aminotransferase